MFKYGKKKPQGATRNLPKSAAPAAAPSRIKSFLPGWLLVGFGIAVGMFFAFVLYLWQPWKPVKKVATPVVAETPDTPAKETGEPRFDFYTLLPSQKVTTPESAVSTTTATPPASSTVTKTDSSKPVEAISGPAALAQRTDAAKASDKKDDGKTDKAAAKQKELDAQKAKDKAAKDKLDKTKVALDKEKALKDKQKAENKQKADDKAKAALAAAEKAKANASKDNVRYTLQAGSFKSNAEADRRRAAIMMSGLPVRVQKVTVKPGQDWYRVVVGPFTGKDKAADARQNLQAEGVDSLMVKVDKK